jgi:hypothetical protein
MSMQQVAICDRDICGEHTTYGPNDPGDYPDNFCFYCADIWLPMRAKMIERHDKEEDALEKEARKLSLEKTNVQG